jgi:hypothetical protein
MVNKIISISSILELPETLESEAKDICGKPYRIQRIERQGEIVWCGYNTNWKFTNGKWHELISIDFVECETPEYEKIYQELRNGEL